MIITTLINLPRVRIGFQLCVRTDEHTVVGKIDHPRRSLSDRPGLAKCRAIVAAGKAVAL